MRAVVLHGPGDLRVQEVPAKACGAGQVLVRVRACGICGSDLPRVAGVGVRRYPLVCGHEFGGTVEEVGEDVTGVKPGQKVSVVPLLPCGRCAFCLARMPFHCSSYDFLGSRSDGGFAEYALAPATNVIPMPDATPDECLAMVEPAAVGCHCVRMAEVGVGSAVLVFGAGPIGIMAAQWARTAGASRVLIADIRPEALDVARRCGLTGIRADEALDALAEATGGIGADVVIEAAGAAQATTAAIACVRRRGTVALLGRMEADYLVPAATLESVLRKEVRLQGVWGFDHWHFPHSDWALACEALAEDRIAATPLVTHRVALERVAEAIEMMQSRSEYYCKVLVLP